LPAIDRLLRRDEDADDPHIPMMIWWALERFSETHRERIVELFEDSELWNAPIARRAIIPRLARRYAAVPSIANQRSLARLAEVAPAGDKDMLRAGVNEAFRGRGIGELTPELEHALFNPGAALDDPLEISLALKRGEPAALAGALGFIVREEAPLQADRVELIAALGDARVSEAVPALLGVLVQSKDQAVREAVLRSLGRFESDRLVADLLEIWSSLNDELRIRALHLLVSRPSWARVLFESVGRSGVIAKSDIPDEVVDRARLYNDPRISELADRYFGKAKVLASEEQQARISQLISIVAAGEPGDAAAGAQTFEARCGICHRLHGRGKEVGPDLTTYDRANVETMVQSIVAPSAAIREGYATVQITTRDRRTLLGFVVERDSTHVTLRDPSGQDLTLAADEIETESVLSLSLMPEELMTDLTDRQLRDFFAYLASPTPPVR
jgi:putative heme-binding domain-containing protein